MKTMRHLILLISALLLSACTTSQTGLREEFDRSVKAYNRMLRWQEIENAGMAFAAPEQREEFLTKAATLKKRGLSVTDYRILTTQYAQDQKSGDVVTEFDYYLLPSNRIKTISYRQNWVFREELKGWKLKSGLPDFE